MPCHECDRLSLTPAQVDYGEPTGPYVETSPGVFTREWTLATVQMDCNTYTPSISLK